jgi:hypothetical protein
LGVGIESIKEEMPFFSDNDNDTKVIFHDCQCAVFFVGQSEHNLHTGIISHLLMDDGLEMNIGICPTGARTNLPIKINNALDEIFAHYGSNNENMLLHTLLIGKISDEQKYKRTMSIMKSMPDNSQPLKIYLSKKLPTYIIPSHFMTVSTFPLSPNGKIDRKLFPEISSLILSKNETYIVPVTELEQTITNI